jgi:hypothetical protein
VEHTVQGGIAFPPGLKGELDRSSQGSQRVVDCVRDRPSQVLRRVQALCLEKTFLRILQLLIYSLEIEVHLVKLTGSSGDIVFEAFPVLPPAR